jgi:HAD superfamily hydrolase (TIGR01509 family)
MPTRRAVLFDFDGVLADTENVHVASWERTFERMGLDVETDVCARAVEVDDRALLRDVFGRLGIASGDVDGWVHRKQELTVTMLRDAPRLYPGVAGLVERLRGRARLAVVSGTWRENVATVLEAAGLAGAFDLIVGKEDVEAVKPDPEAYRLALKRLRVKASEAVALEDSATGLESARAAGIRAVAVGHRQPRGEWSGAVPFLDDLRDPEAVLAALGLD